MGPTEGLLSLKPALFAYFVFERRSVFICSNSFYIFQSFVWYVLVLSVCNVLTVLTVHTGDGLFLVVLSRVLTVFTVLVGGVYFAWCGMQF